MSIPVDMVPSDFAPRPWPRRAPEQSPLAGRTVLVVDDDLERARDLAGELALAGCAARATRGDEALERALAEEAFEAIVLDPEELSGDDCRALLDDAADALLISAEGAAPLDLTRRVFAHLPRPLSVDAVLQALGRGLEARTLQEENRALREELSGRHRLGQLVTRDPHLAQQLETARAVADTRATVLVLGESGTGKSLLARGLHGSSAHRAGPFVAVNCGALPGGLLESELFGHVKGAFTGAVRDKIGRFEQAQGGTIFLDEVDSAPLELQVKLLRVLQERTFERVGEERTRTTDARVIAATNADLPAAIEAGTFREDLFWRLNVVQLRLPALRERPGDVPLLARHFLERFAAEHGREALELSGPALAALVASDWPGNVRQLENALERAVLLSPGPRIELDALPRELRPGDTGGAAPHPGTLTPGAPDGLLAGLAHLTRLTELPTLKDALEAPERALVVRALELAGGCRQAAADSLGISRSTLFNKMRKYDLLALSFEPPRS